MFIEPIKYYDANITIDTLNKNFNVIFQIINKENSYFINAISNHIPYLFSLFIIIYSSPQKNSANLLNKIK